MARSDGDFAHSLADLMSGVAVTFLVLAAIFMVQAAKATKTLETENEKNRDLAIANEEKAKQQDALQRRIQTSVDILKALREVLSSDDVVAEYNSDRDPYLLTLTLNRDRFRFGSARCTMRDEQQDRLLEALRRVIPLVCAPLESGLERRVSIEGHTDNLPLLGGECPGVRPPRSCRRERDRAGAECHRDSFEANVRLSWERANYVSSVARRLHLEEDVMRCLERDVNVSGRGAMEPVDGRPVGDVRSGLEHEQNRRVVIKVHITAPVVVSP